MRPKGKIVRNPRGFWAVYIKKSIFSPFKPVKDKYGEPMVLHFKNSAIHYLVEHCNVLTKDVLIVE